MPQPPSRATRWGGAVFDACIRLWVRVLGRRVDPTETSWIGGPTGTTTRVGPDVYDDVARQIDLHRADGDAGSWPTSIR